MHCEICETYPRAARLSTNSVRVSLPKEGDLTSSEKMRAPTSSGLTSMSLRSAMVPSMFTSSGSLATSSRYLSKSLLSVDLLTVLAWPPPTAKYLPNG